MYKKTSRLILTPPHQILLLITMTVRYHEHRTTYTLLLRLGPLFASHFLPPPRMLPKPKPSKTLFKPNPPRRLLTIPPRPRPPSNLPTRPRTPLRSNPTAARIWKSGSIEFKGAISFITFYYRMGEKGENNVPVNNPHKGLSAFLALGISLSRRLALSMVLCTLAVSCIG